MLAAALAPEARRFGITSEAVADMDRWVERTCRHWGVDNQLLFRARLCVAELATNVLEHGQVPAGSGAIDLALRHVPPGIEIELSDPGIPFDPTTWTWAVEPSLDQFGGRGLRLVRSFARSINYRRDRNRNFLTV